jgi:hypothetical protein
MAAIVEMDDAALAARIGQLEAATRDPELGDDNLTGAGWVELHELQAERERRAPRCGLCRGVGPLAPGRTICANCAYFPLD